MTQFTLGSLPVQFDRTARDFETIRDQAFDLIRAITPEWTDFSPGDPGVALVESFAQLADVLHYAIDRAQNEAYLITAQERASVTKMLALIGYELAPRSTASVSFTVVTNLPNVVIPKGHKVVSKASPSTPSQTFEFLSTVTLVDAGTHTATTDPELVAAHGTSVTGEVVGSSSGLQNQQYVLSQSPAATTPGEDAPLRVYVDEEEWGLSGPGENGRSFLTNDPEDKVFGYRIDSQGVLTLRFGDGVNGMIPPIGAEVTCDYRIGGGALANSVGRNTLTELSPPIAGVLAITNPEQPSGGADSETIEHAKRYGPLSLRTLDRAITLEDYESLALQVPGGGVLSARAYQGRSPWIVQVYLIADGDNPVPTGKWYPQLNSGTGLIGSVGRFLTSRKAAPARLEVFGVTVTSPKIDMTVYAKPNFLRTAVRGEVQDRLRKMFVDLRSRFGIGVPVSRVVQVVENTPGVDWVQMNEMHRKPGMRVLRGSEGALSVSTVVIEGVTAQTVPDTYEVRWRTSSQYEIVGTRNRLFDKQRKSYYYDTGVEYRIRLYPVSTKKNVPEELDQFKIAITTDVSSLPRRGDIWVFGIDSLVSNIDVLPHEVIQANLLADGKLDYNDVNIRIEGGIGR